jgi:hypothetical protein
MSTSIHALCDAAFAQAADGKRGPSHPRLEIATTILASSLAFIDGSVVNVGLPAIGASFQADAAATSGHRTPGLLEIEEATN